MRLIVFVLVCLLAGCGAVRCKFNGLSGGDDEPKRPPMLISVSGYGAIDTSVHNPAQQKLMALRASEIDAYRAMAERVRGLQISGSTKVEDFVARHDNMSAVVDSFVRTAKIMSQNVLDNGICETILSLEIDQPFYSMLDQDDEQRTESATMDAPVVAPVESEVALPTLSSSSQFDLSSQAVPVEALP